jgi:hypothetical protein
MLANSSTKTLVSLYFASRELIASRLASCIYIRQSNLS